MPIRKVEENGETRYEGLQNLDDVGWADWLVVARGPREHVIRELTKQHLFDTEKHRRQCTLLLGLIKGLIAEGTNADGAIEEALENLASEVQNEATNLADFHPLAGLDLEVDYDREKHVWTGGDGEKFGEALSNHRIDHIKYLHGKPEPVKITPGAARLLDQAATSKSLTRALKLVRKATKLNKRAQARRAKRAA